MHTSPSLPGLAITVFAGFFLFAVILLAPAIAFAADPLAANTLATPASRLPLDDTDEIAALDAIGFALGEVGDGSTYVWHRHHGRLSGIIRPTGSFKDSVGQVCRHFVTIMISGGHSRKLESIACRLPDGRWQLDG